MSTTGSVAAGILGGTTTMIARSATRHAMRGRSGAPRVPRGARARRGLGMVLVWAAAAGVVLAMADLLLEQRKDSSRDE